jgi:hypothetical protein
MSRKTKKRRDQIDYPGLDPSYAPKNRREVLDIDYFDQLNDKEKQWMNKFLEEYIGADLDFKNLKNNLHNTKKLKKDCTDRNNARNRDMLGFAKANGLTVPEEQIQDHHLNSANPGITEDSLIAFIDNREILERIDLIKNKKLRHVKLKKPKKKQTNLVPKKKQKKSRLKVKRKKVRSSKKRTKKKKR